MVNFRICIIQFHLLLSAPNGLPEISLAGNFSKELAPTARDAAIDVAADTDGSDNLWANVDAVVVVGDKVDIDEDF